MFVVVSLSLVFFGISKLGDIEEKALREAKRGSRRALQDLARRETKMQSVQKGQDYDETEPLDGEEESELQ